MEKNKYLICKSPLCDEPICQFEFDNIGDCFNALKKMSDMNPGVVYTVIEEKTSSSVFCTFVTEKKDN